jgi:hypothetical protein
LTTDRDPGEAETLEARMTLVHPAKVAPANLAHQVHPDQGQGALVGPARLADRGARAVEENARVYGQRRVPGI